MDSEKLQMSDEDLLPFEIELLNAIDPTYSKNHPQNVEIKKAVSPAITKRSPKMDKSAMMAAYQAMVAPKTSTSENYVKLTEGVNTLRILPLDKLYIKLTHWINKRPISCLGEDSCPICAKLREIGKGYKGKEWGSKMGGRTAQKALLFNVLLPDGNVKVIQASGMLQEKLMEKLFDDKLDITDLKTGNDLQITVVTGKDGRASGYLVNVAPSSEVDDDVFNQKIHDLDALIKPFHTVDDLMKIASTMT
jgi:hypothetical protein